MKKIFLFLLLFMILNPPAIAGLFDEIDREFEAKYGRSSSPSSVRYQRIEYGYNAVGDYVPTSVGNQRIEYGYNAVGDYVPTSVGGRRIEYGYNAYGDYVPMGY